MKAKKQAGRKISRTPRDFERLAAGMWQRDTTPEEEAKILQAKRDARAEIIARKVADTKHTDRTRKIKTP